MNSGINLILKRTRPAATYLMAVFLLTVLLQVVASAQDANDIDPEFNVALKTVAPVKLDGNELFFVRGIASYPADLRASTIEKRIQKVASESSVPADSVFIVPFDDRQAIYAGKELILNVYDLDAKSEGVSQVQLAGVYQHKIISAISLYRSERTSASLLKNSLYASAAVVLLIVILFVFLRLISRINLALQKRIKSRIEQVENQSYNLIRSGHLWNAFHALFSVLKVIITIIIIAVFLEYMLGLFPWTNELATGAFKLILNPLISLGSGFIHFLPGLIFISILFIITRYILKLIRLFFTGVQEGAISIKSLEPDTAMPTYKIFRLVLIATAVIIAYPYIPGSGSDAFKGVSVFFGILISLGSSSFIGNVIAGYTLIYRGAFKIGDRVKVNDHAGFVEEQKLLVTRLRSYKNEEIIIPNSELLNSSIINYNVYAKGPGIILHSTVGIGYETPWRKVEAMLKLAADRTEGLLKEPSPFVHVQALGDFAVTYQVNAYCNDVLKMYFIYSGLHQHILDVFNENNVQIMTPAYEGDPEIPKTVPKEQWNSPLANEK
jgi:small-conductance mechanosensitive channel